MTAPVFEQLLAVHRALYRAGARQEALGPRVADEQYLLPLGATAAESATYNLGWTHAQCSATKELAA